MSINIEAFQVAEAFNLKKLRAEFRAELHSGNASELFYFFQDDSRYLHIFDYGVVVFGNYDEIGKSQMLQFVRTFADNWLDKDLTETYRLEVDEKVVRHVVRNDFATVGAANPSVVRIAMLNVGQSVALEYYETLTDDLLNSTKKLTQDLEMSGKLSIPKQQLLKFIGRTLNIKNSIVDNLYILDDPNLVWDDADLDHFNRNLKTNFDTFARFKDLDYRLQTVENNLRLFTEVLNQREGTRLEWIIIILIAFEILNSFLRH